MSTATRWLPAALYAGLIFWLSEQPQAAVAPYLPFFSADKLAHAAEYAGLALLVRRALAPTLGGARGAVAAAVIAAAYGAFDEWHQSWDPGKNRVASWDDALADLLGASLAAWAAHRRARGRSPA